MFELLAVTNRKLCAGDFLERLDAIASAGVSAVILREKDLSPADYAVLFARARAICARRGVLLIAHGAGAAGVGAAGLHLPFAAFEALAAGGGPARAGGLTGDDSARGAGLPPGVRVGVSVHSAGEARRAARGGASYVVAGHVFQTESKAALAPRGLAFLSEICASVALPVYAIGGISPQNIASVKEAGAAGACLMSSFMSCADPGAHANALRRALR
jgi:thiamine-phosphate pyrophosphorylase